MHFAATVPRDLTEASRFRGSCESGRRAGNHNRFVRLNMFLDGH
jgi:hypothetical protein